MTCCPIITKTFVNEMVTTIPYTGLLPIISVGYLQDDSTLQFEGLFYYMQVTPTDIIITHGGPSTGVVKILQ